jgi:hypothetical protein
MNALDLARWQFGIVTVYHFLFASTAATSQTAAGWNYTVAPAPADTPAPT